MSDRIALEKLGLARDPNAHVSGERVWSGEVLEVIDEFRSADPDSGKPADAFSELALDLLSGKDVQVGGASVKGLASGECSSGARRRITNAQEEARAKLWRPDNNGGAIVLPPKDQHPVFLSKDSGFVTDANGTRPAGAAALGNALFEAGEWVQASFGSGDNLFAAARLDVAGKRAVVDQFRAVVDSDLRGLNEGQRYQLLGNVAGLLVELIKSVEVNLPAPVSQREARELINSAYSLLMDTMTDDRVGVNARQMLLGYLKGADSFRNKLEPAQRTEIDAKYLELNPTHPFDYEAWQLAGKDVIRVHDIEGEGEGFIQGAVEWFTKTFGLGDGNWRNGRNLFELVDGDGLDGNQLLRCRVPANDPINKWGREMTVEIAIRPFRNNMGEGLGMENVDITGYNGHSGFARNTLRSLPTWPAQRGDKLFYRHVCAGMDAENPIALKSPKAFANSYTTQDSGYFRKDAGNTYAVDAEGLHALRCYIRGALGKKSHAEIQADLKARANWYGHTPGNDNNFVGPGDRRRGGSGDWDQDGIPNMFDVMPTGNLFNVAEDTAREFELKVPAVSADKIKGDRAFQAIQFVNTATNYSAIISDFNHNRAIKTHPEGVWFDGLSDPNTYVRFSDGPVVDGIRTLHVQLSSALADMSMEALRAVLFYETSRYLVKENQPWGVREQAEQVGANLLFATAGLEYDMGFRDSAIFDGLKRMFGIPASVDFYSFQGKMYELAERHNYTGDQQALNDILGQHRQALSAAGVGNPAIPVTA